MGLINYTTDVLVSKTVGEIMEKLRESGASGVTLEYDAKKRPSGFSFRVATHGGMLDVRLPVNLDKCEQVLRNQYHLMLPYGVVNGKTVWDIMRDGGMAKMLTAGPPAAGVTLLPSA